MGFFDKLEKTWTTWGVSKGFDLLGESWGNFGTSAKQFASGVYGLWSAAFGDEDFGKSLNAFKESGKAFGRGAVTGLSGLFELPVLHQIAGTSDWATHELASRPLATVGLMAGDFFQGKDNLSWRTAYNDTRKVSAGQGITYGAFSLFDDVANSLGINQAITGVEGGVNAAPGVDPRTPEGQRKFHEDPGLKFVSGTTDAYIQMFGDPTVVGGKAGLVAKTKFLSKPMTAAAIKRGDYIKYMDTGRYERFRSFVKEAPNAERVRQRAFAGHRSGDKAAALLWSVRNEDDLYDATFESLYGDLAAWDYLVENAPRIADVTGSTYANRTIADAAKKAGQDSKADAIVDALRETKTQAFVDAIANGKGAWGAGFGSQIGQNLPRLSLTSKWRDGVHQWLTFGPAVFRGKPIYPAASRARMVLPTARFTRFLDINDANSVGSFRANIERGPLSRDQVEQFVSQYGRASSAEGRDRAVRAAEDATLHTLAAKHGFTAQEVNDALPVINKWRVGNRRTLTTSRRFISRDARTLAEKYRNARMLGHPGGGRLLEADATDQLATDVEAAVARGDQPESVLTVLDEDGNMVMLPERFRVNPEQPITVSQHADVLSMVDWRVLDSALWWVRKGPAGTKAYHVVDAAKAMLDTVNSLWKVTALIRPGYVWRMLSDDVMRRGTLLGAGKVFMATARGVANSGRNWAARYGTVRDQQLGRRAQLGLDPVERVDGDLDSVGPLPPRPEVGGPYTAEQLRTIADASKVQPASTDELSGGMSRTDRLNLPGGGRLISKKYKEMSHGGDLYTVDQQMDAEELSSLVGRALGVRVPEVYRPSDGGTELFMEHVPGRPAAEVYGWDADFNSGPVHALADDPRGRLLGLFDIIIANYDRHARNWMSEGDADDIARQYETFPTYTVNVPDDVYEEGIDFTERQMPGHLLPEPIAIDHGNAFMFGTPTQLGGGAGTFDRHYFDLFGKLKDNDLTPADIAEARRRLESVKPDFERLGRLDWFEGAMERLRRVGEHAKGTVDRIGPAGSVNPVEVPILEYESYDRALADGVISIDDYLDKVRLHADRGDLPAELSFLAQGRNDGVLTSREYHRQVVDRALRNVGRGAYSEPHWQKAFIDEVIREHFDKMRGEPGVASVVDPLLEQPSNDFLVRRVDDAGQNLDAANRPEGLHVSKFDTKPDMWDTWEHGAVQNWGRVVPNNALYAPKYADGSTLPAGLAALRKLLSPDDFKAMTGMSADEVYALIEREFPGKVDPPEGRMGAYALMEAYAGLEARRRGYDAIVVDDASSVRNEMILLDNSIVRWGEQNAATEAPILVDPASGVTPTKVDTSEFSMRGAQEGDPVPDFVYDYIADNIDELLKPDSLLHAYITPAGKLNLAVASYVGKSLEPIKPTAGIRVKFRGQEGRPKHDSGTSAVSVITKQGVIKFDAAFEGMEGARFRAQASSRGPKDAWVDQMADTQYARLMNETAGHKDVSSDEPQYAETWQRVANLQLGNDDVARMVLSGKNDDEIISWMRNTPEGRAYWGKLGPWQSRYVEQIYTVRAMVEKYIPEDDRLRKLVLERKARYTDLARVIDKEDMPDIHGAALDVSVGGPFTNAVKKGVDKIFKVLSDIPADKASRFPFFADRYTTHLEDLARGWVAQYENAGKVLPVEAVDKIQRTARERALADVKKYLYDSSSALDMAAAGRLLVPFSTAIADSFLKWGMIAREKGMVGPVLNIWKIWTAPDRNGLVQDQDGNIKVWEDGQYVWYSVHPKTGERVKLEGHEPKQEYITFQLPAGIGPDTKSGAKMPLYINKDTFNTFLGLPTAGPIVTYPANAFLLKNPEVAENWFVKKFVLPYGPSRDQWRSLVPANVRGTYYWITGDKDGFRNLAQSVMQTEYTRYSLGLRSEPPTMAEVQETAMDMAGFQWAAQFMGLSTQAKSPYQPYIDYYHQLQAQDPANALSRFYAEMGDEFRMMTASVSRNVIGLPASLNTFKAQQKYRDLISKFPELAPLIVGAEGAGSFSSAVYEAQLNEVLQPGSDAKIREIMTLQDSVEDAERRRLWLKYGKLMDAIHADMAQRGLTSITQKGAKDLKKARDKFIQENMYWTNPQGVKDTSPWFEEFATTDRTAMTKRLTGMAQIVSDPALGNRDDMRGLREYLTARIELRNEMKRRKFATLDSQKASRLRSEWNRYVFQLKDENLAFAQLYDRWLTQDDMKADIDLGGGVFA